MRCYGHMAHGTSPLYTSVRSLRDLHSVGPSALGCVNSVETCTSVYNLHIDYRATTSYYVYGIGNGLISRDTPPNTHPEIDSRIGIENGIESILYHMDRYGHLRRKPVSMSKLRSRFSSGYRSRNGKNQYHIDSIVCYPMLKRSRNN